MNKYENSKAYAKDSGTKTLVPGAKALETGAEMECGAKTLGTAAEVPGSKTHKQFVGDVGTPLTSSGEKASAGAAMMLFSLAIGLIVGVIVWAVLVASSALTNLLWKDARAYFENTLEAAHISSWWLPFAFCVIGGLLIGLWTWRTHTTPESLNTVMKSVKDTGGYKLKRPFASIVAFLLPLIFGGSIGPEAGLTGIIAAGCTRVGNALKAAGLRIKNMSDVTISAALSAVFAAPFFGIVLATERSIPKVDLEEKTNGEPPNPKPAFSDITSKDASLNNYEFKKSAKIIIYTASALGAATGIALFTSILGQSGGIPRFSGANVGLAELYWALPCLAIGYIAALLYHAGNAGFSYLSARIKNHPIIKPLFAGIVLGSLGIAFPYVLFPGEEQSFELMQNWQEMAGWVLLVTGLLKCLATPLCLKFGWCGGHFFPCIFAGIAAGYGIATLSGANEMFCVCITCATLMAAIQRKPLMALALLLLCFPAQDVIWLGIACLIGAYIPMPAKLLEMSKD